MIDQFHLDSPANASTLSEVRNNFFSFNLTIFCIVLFHQYDTVKVPL